MIEITPELAIEIHRIQQRPDIIACPIHADEVTGRVRGFPIFKTDKDIDIINRYFKMFPEESKAHIDAFSEWAKTAYDEKGMSKLGTIRLGMKIPIALYKFIQIMNPEYWHDKKNMRRFSQMCSKLSVGKI